MQAITLLSWFCYFSWALAALMIAVQCTRVEGRGVICFVTHITHLEHRLKQQNLCSFVSLPCRYGCISKRCRWDAISVCVHTSLVGCKYNYQCTYMCVWILVYCALCALCMYACVDAITTWVYAQASVCAHVRAWKWAHRLLHVHAPLHGPTHRVKQLWNLSYGLHSLMVFIQ